MKNISIETASYEISQPLTDSFQKRVEQLNIYNRLTKGLDQKKETKFIDVHKRKDYDLSIAQTELKMQTVEANIEELQKSTNVFMRQLNKLKIWQLESHKIYLEENIAMKEQNIKNIRADILLFLEQLQFGDTDRNGYVVKLIAQARSDIHKIQSCKVVCVKV